MWGVPFASVYRSATMYWPLSGASNDPSYRPGAVWSMWSEGEDFSPATLPVIFRLLTKLPLLSTTSTTTLPFRWLISTCVSSWERAVDLTVQRMVWAQNLLKRGPEASH